MTDVARRFYPERENSVRAQIARREVIDSLMDEGLLIPKKEKSGWLYISDEQKLRDVFLDNGIPKEVAHAKIDGVFKWIDRIEDKDKPAFQYFKDWFRKVLILDYLEHDRNLQNQDIQLVNEAFASEV